MQGLVATKDQIHPSRPSEPQDRKAYIALASGHVFRHQHRVRPSDKALGLALASPPALWGSARFRRLLEGVAFSLLWLYTPLPWLALLPACYFAAAFLYGDPDGPEANVNRVFPAADRGALLPVSRYLGLALLFFLAKVPVLMG